MLPISSCMYKRDTGKNPIGPKGESSSRIEHIMQGGHSKLPGYKPLISTVQLRRLEKDGLRGGVQKR